MIVEAISIGIGLSILGLFMAVGLLGVGEGLKEIAREMKAAREEKRFYSDIGRH